MPLTFHYTFLLLAAGALLVQGRHRRLACVGLVPVALGIAAITIRLGGGLSGLALRAAERGAPLSFLQINSGLMLLGIGLVIVAVCLGLAAGSARAQPWAAALLVGAGAGPMMAAHVPLFTYVGWMAPLGAAAGVAAVTVVLYLVGRLLQVGRPVAWINRWILDRRPPSSALATTLYTAACAVGGAVLIWLSARSPEGMAFRAPLLMPLALVLLWHVAASAGTPHRLGRLVEMLLGLAFFGIFAGGTGLVGAGWLLVAAVAAPWMSPFLQRAVGVLFWLPVAWACLLVLTGGLATQVTYTVLAAVGIAVTIWVYHPSE